MVCVGKKKPLLLLDSHFQRGGALNTNKLGPGGRMAVGVLRDRKWAWLVIGSVARFVRRPFLLLDHHFQRGRGFGSSHGVVIGVSVTGSGRGFMTGSGRGFCWKKKERAMFRIGFPFPKGRGFEQGWVVAGEGAGSGRGFDRKWAWF